MVGKIIERALVRQQVAASMNFEWLSVRTIRVEQDGVKLVVSEAIGVSWQPNETIKT